MSDNFHILLVEDNRADQRLTVEALKELDVDTVLHTAVDGEEALAYLQRVGKDAATPRPSLILLDTSLPKVSGEEVLAQLERMSDLRRIPVVVLTGASDPAFIRHIYGLQADCYVTKPIDADRHIEVIKIIVNYWVGICARHGHA